VTTFATQYSSSLEDCIAFLFTYHPLAYDAQGNYASAPGYRLSLVAPVTGPTPVGHWTPGTAIQAISDSIITQHQPVLVGCGPESQWHQMLVVGVAKIEDKTYDIAIDSGFSGDNHPGPLYSATVPLSAPTILQYTLSDRGVGAGLKFPTSFGIGSLPAMILSRTLTTSRFIAKG
jgi:hypothetical protein